MRDLPSTIWMMGGFLLLCSALVIYNMFGVRPVPKVVNVWTEVDTVLRQIDTRTLKLQPGKSTVQEYSSFHLYIDRHKNLTQHQYETATYLLRFKPKRLSDKLAQWIGGGVEIAIIDQEPNSSFGNTRLVSLKWNEEGAEL